MADPPPKALPRVQLTPEQLRVKEEMDRRSRMSRALGRIRHKIIVMSGKGGVGKTTVAVNLAASLSRRGYRTGLLDLDLTGPDVARMLGLVGTKFPSGAGLIRPVESKPTGVRVATMSFLLKDDAPVVWRGPLKAHALGQFLGDTAWGDLDFLVLDMPPGTSDEPLAVAENIRDADGCVVVTTPQAVSTDDVKKAVTFVRLVELKVLGVLENMSGFECPNCHESYDVFGKAGGGQALAQEANVRFLGRVPLDPELVRGGDEGMPFVLGRPESVAAKAFEGAVDALLEAVSEPLRIERRRA